jgi:hypothetical protein
MKSKLHAAIATLALLTITTFWLSTLISELWLNPESVVKVKNGILMGMWLLIPLMAASGISGFILAGPHRGTTIRNKILRMKIAAANGLIILLPSAYILAKWANQGIFDSNFYLLQAIELLAGAINITLLSLNLRDGLRMR